MATTTLTTDLVTVAIGSLATDAGTWDGGKAHTQHTVPFYVEGTESIEFTANQATTYDFTYSPPTSINVGTSSVVRMWFIDVDFFRWGTKAASAPWRAYFNNSFYFTYHGSDTYKGGWEQAVIDTGLTATSGTAAWTAVTDFGFQGVFSVLGKNTPTIWMDVIRYGNVVNAYGGTSGDEIDVEGIAAADKAQAYGIIIKDTANNVFNLRGELNIGDSVSTNTTYFKIENKVIVGEALEWIDIDILQMNFVGNSTGTTDIDVSGCFINAADKRMTIDVSDTDIDSLVFDGNTFGNVTGLSFQNGFSITNNVFNQCYQVTPNSSTFTGNALNNTLDTDGAMRWTSDCGASGCSFNNNSRAIVVPAAVTSLTLDNMKFNGNTVDIYWEGTAGTLTVSLTNGSNASISGSAGGTVVIQASVTLQITGLQSGTEVFIYDTNETGNVYTDDTLLASTDTISLVADGTKWKFVYPYNASTLGGTTVNIKIMNLVYIIQRIDYELTSSNATIPVTQIIDRVYKNPT